MRINVLGVGFDNCTIDQAVAEAIRLMGDGGCHYVVTPNPEIVEMCREDGEVRRIINGADLVLPDGVGVIYAARMLGTPLRQRVPGVDFAQGLMAAMAGSGRTLFLLGAKPGVAEAARRRLEAAYPGLRIVGTHDGYFQEDGPVVQAVRESGADVVFVCLGAPKQEKWIARFGLLTGAKLAIGLGGALDVFAGQVERAPEKWQRAGMEWAYRLMKEPKRAGRMAKLPLVLVKAAGRRVTGRGKGETAQ